MSDLYSIDNETQTVNTKTCVISNDTVNDELIVRRKVDDTTYEDMLVDLAHCYLAAVSNDDRIMVMVVCRAMHALIGSCLDLDAG